MARFQLQFTSLCVFSDRPTPGHNRPDADPGELRTLLTEYFQLSTKLIPLYDLFVIERRSFDSAPRTTVDPVLLSVVGREAQKL